MSIVRWPKLLELLGYFSLAIAASMILPLLLALFFRDDGLVPLLGASALSAAIGAILITAFRGPSIEFNHREAIVMVVLTWMVAITLGALPFYFSEFFSSFTDSFFESASGFTTTGATILDDIESVAGSLLFWRSLTHWLGGMGIILLGLAILPLIGTGGMALYRAEFSGSSSEKLKPRIAETASSLWRIYFALTLACFLLLMVAGMGPFEAICHAFATMATGGFSTRNISIESFHSPLIESVIILFMFLAGINFALQYRLLVERRIRRFVRDRELHVYLVVIITATAAILLSLTLVLGIQLAAAFRVAVFQVVSILTTTGFSSADFALWTPFAQLVLLALMFFGGCTGSTAGGLKIARMDLLLQVIRRQFKKMVERRGVFAIHTGQETVSEATIQSLLNLVYLAFLVNFGACLLLTAFGVDVFTAISAVAASMFNIGPGLGAVGPAENYASFPALVKWTLTLCMIAGRLEFYAFLVVLSRSFWKK